MGRSSRLLIGKGMVEEAIVELEHAVSINPQAGYSYLQLVSAQRWSATTLAQKRPQTRRLSCRRVHLGKEGLQVVGAHTRLGYCYYRQGRYTTKRFREYERELEFLNSSGPRALPHDRVV